MKDSPAEKAGIARGDRIEEIAGKSIASFRDIAAALQFRQAGEKVRITISRAGKPLRLNVKLGERPAGIPRIAFSQLGVPEDPRNRRTGILPQLAEHLTEIPELPETGDGPAQGAGTMSSSSAAPGSWGSMSWK